MADAATRTPVDFDEVISRSQATTLDALGKMFALSTDLQRGIFTKHVDEVEMVEAAATRQLTYREAPIEPAK